MMERRSLLKTLGISAIGLATAPLWMNGWTSDQLPPEDYGLTKNQRQLIRELVGTIIPATDIPGAKELEVDRFILQIVNDCYDEEVQEEFIAGLNEVDEVSKALKNKSFLHLTYEERIFILNNFTTVEPSPTKSFNSLSFLKDLTINGYMSSQYILENILGYELVPSRFHGSFPIEESIYSKI